MPALSLGEVMVKPRTMMYRNFLAMKCEELLRSHPIDGAVLISGCDKATPVLLMGAIGMDLPAIFFPAGPMLNGQWRGEHTGSGTHTKKYWEELRAGNISQADWIELEGRLPNAMSAAMRLCIRSICRRPTAAATSIFSKVVAHSNPPFS